MSEEWRDVVGWEGLYQVSDDGRIRSLDRRVACGRRGRGLVRGRNLKPYIDRDGYGIVSLRRPGSQHRARVHRLVAEAFIPNPNGHPWVLHWDDDPGNNHVLNLRWGMPSENSIDSVRNGNNVNARKSACPRGHLLVEPNLVPHLAARGTRSCRACQAEHMRSYRGQGGFSVALADENYREIMEVAA